MTRARRTGGINGSDQWHRGRRHPSGRRREDTIYGNGGNDTLEGGTGFDRVYGGDGNDVISSSPIYHGQRGDYPDEILDGGSGDDTFYVSYSGGSYRIEGGDGYDTLHMDASGADLFFSEGAAFFIGQTFGATFNGIEHIVVRGSGRLESAGVTASWDITGTGDGSAHIGSGNDRVTGYEYVSSGGGDDYVTNSWWVDAGDGNDYVEAFDTVYGGAGNDILNAPSMFGGTGNDIFVVSTNSTVEEAANEGNDTVQSSISYTLGANVENLTLTGSSAIDGLGNSLDNIIDGNNSSNVLRGMPGTDTLNGHGGDDMIFGGRGADTMNGGVGNDTFSVEDAGDVVIEATGEGTDRVTSTVSYTLAANVENLTLTGSSAIDGLGNSLDNIIDGNSASNVLRGMPGTDTLNGHGGNDMIFGGLGADTMNGGPGNDTFSVDDAGDVVIEATGEGIDRVTSTVSHTLAANVENLELTGTATISGTGNALSNVIVGNRAANTLIGGSGNDSLIGGLGADTLVGGIGNDVYYVDSVGDIVTEAFGEGNDLVKSSVDYVLGDNVERLSLAGSGDISGTGNAGANIITGNDSANSLHGEGRNDRLSGGAGNDQLHGGVGNDRLTGGAGADGFHFDTALNARNNVDTITDFTVADDTMHLDQSVFTTLDLGTLAEGAFVHGTAAADGDDRIIYDSATGRIFYDADGSGDGAAVQFAQVTAGTALSSADFIIG